MKTITNFKLLLLLSTVIISFSACKKDKEEPEPKTDPIETVRLTITELKAKSTAKSVILSEKNKVFRIKGVVVSDNSTTGKNIDPKTAVLTQEDNAAGILVNFATAHSFVAGTELEIGVSNQKLEQINGEIILNAIPLDSAKSTASGKTIIARQTTVADIKTNKAAWDGTLVTVNATELSSGDGKYNGILTLKDATGELKSAIIGGAAFENNDLPVSISKIIGIVRVNGSDVRIDLRSISDVTAGDVATIEYVDIYGEMGFVGGNNRSAKVNPVGVDASFADPNKIHGYLMRVNTKEQIKNLQNQPAGLYTYTSLKAGAKELTVTFAASQLQGAVNGQSFGDFFGDFTLDPFTGTKHNVKIGIALVTGGGSLIYGAELIGESPVYNEAGKFYSFKVKLPITEAELTTLNATDAIYEDWLNAPKIAIFNLSNKRSTAGLYEEEGGLAPVLISQVAVGY